MANYKTPGVYVQEINAFPPIIAPVSTAVPAFIGYTEKAEKRDGTPLTNVPVRISSMLEYELYFGGSPNQKDISVNVINGNIQVTLDPSKRNKHLMHPSLQMYFANGGGPCYIVSAGGYSNSGTLQKAALKNALDQLEKENEPTLIVFPEATNLLSVECYELYKDALMQCHKLQDRFTIVDTKMQNLTTYDVEDDMKKLREGINLEEEYRRYGAAYYPYLNSTLSYKYKDEEVNVSQITTPNYSEQVDNIITSLAVDDSLMQGYITELNTLNALFSNTLTPTELEDLYDNITLVVTNIITSTQRVITGANNTVSIAENVLANNPNTHIGYAELLSSKNLLDSAIANELDTVISALNANLVQLTSWDDSDPNAQDNLEDILSGPAPSIFVSVGEGTANTLADIITNILSDTGSNVASMQQVSVDLGPFSVPNPVSLEVIAATDNALYNSIKAAIAQVSVVLPPSASVAGAYARVDTNEGVWKAPANVGINYVLGPVTIITDQQQGDLMNVDSVAGKSVNAIRPFIGKGTLIWGARTLDGNSAEWRYVPVRRFYIFAETSIRRATEPFVFESNDTNTWVSIRSMISSFLTLQWKAGALAGASTDQAFYVNVGLGSTMTPEDILNGTMVIEVGMAVVRPAEFIVLKFTHKMQEI